MEIQRTMIVCLMCMITWKETMNQQIPPGTNFDKRFKRNHESDQDKLSKLLTNKQIKVGRETKNVTPSTLAKSDSQVLLRPLNLISGNKNLAKKIIIPQKKILIRPINKTNRNIVDKHMPYVFYVKNHDVIDTLDEQIKVNKTITHQIAEQDKLVENQIEVDTKDDIKITTTKPETISKNILEKSIEDTINQHKSSNTVKTKTDSKSNKIADKINKRLNNGNNATSSKKAEAKLVSDEYLKKDNNSPITKIDTSLQRKLNDTKNNEVNDVENIFPLDFSTKIDHSNTEEKSENSKTQVETLQPKKHPFLEAIRNDLYKTCSPLEAPNVQTNEVKISNNDVEMVQGQEKIKSANDLGSINRLSLDNDNTEKEDIIISDNYYEELLEISSSPQVPMDSQLNTLQDNINPVQYDNNYQVPYNYYHSQDKLDFNNNNQYASVYAPNEQRIEEIDGTTVISYKNYFKTPTGYGDWNNYNRINSPATDYLNYGYQGSTQPISPLMVGNNQWNRSGGFGNKANREVKDRIWRSWRNRAYNIKSRNALKQLSNTQFYSGLENLTNAGKVINRNDIKLDGYYRNQNTPPYL